MRRPGPNYRFEDFHAIQSIDDEGFLFNWSKTNPWAPLNKVFQPTNEQELRSILLGGYETVRVVGSNIVVRARALGSSGEAGPAALIDLRSWTGQVAVSEDFVTYKAATTVDQLNADLLEIDRMLLACPGVIGIQNSSRGTSGHLYLLRGPAIVPQLLNTNQAATLTGASTMTIAHGSGNTDITLIGSDFIPGVAVTWNGSYRLTRIVDSTHLSVAIPASDLSKPGAATLTAINPGAGPSSSLTINVQ